MKSTLTVYFGHRNNYSNTVCMSYTYNNVCRDVMLSFDNISDTYTWFDTHTSRQKMPKFGRNDTSRKYMTCDSKLITYIILRWPNS